MLCSRKAGTVPRFGNGGSGSTLVIDGCVHAQYLLPRLTDDSVKAQRTHLGSQKRDVTGWRNAVDHLVSRHGGLFSVLGQRLYGTLAFSGTQWRACARPEIGE